jgi:hypothetical protein
VLLHGLGEASRGTEAHAPWVSGGVEEQKPGRPLGKDGAGGEWAVCPPYSWHSPSARWGAKRGSSLSQTGERNRTTSHGPERPRRTNHPGSTSGPRT